MDEAATDLVDDLLPLVPVRQFIVTFPVQLPLWQARSKSLCAKVCEKVCAELTAHLQAATGIEKGLSGPVVFIQRLASAASLNIHLHVNALDGVYEKKSTGRLKFHAAHMTMQVDIRSMQKLPSRHMNTNGSKNSCAPMAKHGTPSHLGRAGHHRRAAIYSRQIHEPMAKWDGITSLYTQ